MAAPRSWGRHCQLPKSPREVYADRKIIIKGGRHVGLDFCGRCQVGSSCFGSARFPSRVAAVATLPSALFGERIVSLGASWVFSFQTVLPGVRLPQHDLTAVLQRLVNFSARRQPVQQNS
jgi:hypothetical protein